MDSADKTARFIMDCNQMKVPLIFLQDVNGFMVGRDSEQDGIIRAGAKLVNAVKSFGALGGDVNLAALLMMTAALDEILITGRVRKAVSEEFLTEARPPLDIKGLVEPVPYSRF